MRLSLPLSFPILSLYLIFSALIVIFMCFCLFVNFLLLLFWSMSSLGTVIFSVLPTVLSPVFGPQYTLVSCLTECYCLYPCSHGWLSVAGRASCSSDVTSSGKSAEPDILVIYRLFVPKILVLTPVLGFIMTCCDGYIFVSNSPHHWRAKLCLADSVS